MIAMDPNLMPVSQLVCNPANNPNESSLRVFGMCLMMTL